MEQAVWMQISAGIVGCLVSWGIIAGYYGVKYRKRREDKAVRRVVANNDFEPMFGRPVSDWSRSFSWKPVHTLDHGYIWLRFYWRRRIYKHQFLHGGDDFWWQNVLILRFVGA